jgi:hypothetical protein
MTRSSTSSWTKDGITDDIHLFNEMLARVGGLLQLPPAAGPARWPGHPTKPQGQDETGNVTGVLGTYKNAVGNYTKDLKYLIKKSITQIFALSFESSILKATRQPFAELPIEEDPRSISREC